MAINCSMVMGMADLEADLKAVAFKAMQFNVGAGTDCRGANLLWGD